MALESTLSMSFSRMAVNVRNDAAYGQSFIVTATNRQNKGCMHDQLRLAALARSLANLSNQSGLDQQSFMD